MTIKEMHYDFKKKLNKIDSQAYRNLKIPEIDWTLNEAAELFVKLVAFPRLRSQLGFEKFQRTIDDIRTIVKTESDQTNCTAVPASNIVTLPSDYWFYLSAKVLMSKDSCADIVGRVRIREHDDEFEDSPFDKSSFEWREVNGVFYENGVKLFTNGFSITSFCLSYIRRLAYMHNAEDYGVGGTYTLPSGVSLTGSQDCELSESTHREIVDLAVLIATGELENPTSYQLKQAKLKLNI